MKLKNINGEKFGRLTVIGRAGNTIHGQAKWNCRCSCGNEVVIFGSALRNGHTKSCGCLRIESNNERSTKHGHATNGISPTYHTWAGMKARCNNPKHSSYSTYGKKGISVCKEWDNFSKFITDMGVKPIGKSLDRIDYNGNYCKENCRWATYKEQSRNKSNNHFFTINGETKTVAEWAEINGISYSSMFERITGKYYSKK